MGIFDRFLSAVRINEDDYDDEEFYDEDDDIEAADTEAEPAKPKKSFFSRIAKRNNDDDFDDFDDEDDYSDEKAKGSAKPSAAAAAAPKSSKQFATKVTPIRRKGNGPMEVNVIKPTSMEDTREIADTLLFGATVVLNLEGIDVDMAQRVIDFASGACYAIDGSLQKVSSYIFILTPQNVEISGDITDILNGSVRS